MKKRLVRKETIEEFDENGRLKTRTVIEETEEEEDDRETSSNAWCYPEYDAQMSIDAPCENEYVGYAR